MPPSHELQQGDTRVHVTHARVHTHTHVYIVRLALPLLLDTSIPVCGPLSTSQLYKHLSHYLSFQLLLQLHLIVLITQFIQIHHSHSYVNTQQLCYFVHIFNTNSFLCRSLPQQQTYLYINILKGYFVAVRCQM